MASPAAEQVDTTNTDSARALLVAEPAPADSASSAHIVMSIGTLTVENLSLSDTLDVIIDAHGVDPAGCQLKIAVDGSLIDIVKILPGELIDSCDWDMFDARPLTRSDSAAGPREVWQIVALAQGASTQQAPKCYAFDRPATLAQVVLSSAHATNVNDTAAAIFFYWESCRDNVISDRQGASLLISDTVVDRITVAHETSESGFPTRRGTPDECVSPRAAAPPRRLVAFRNGGVVFKLAVDTSDKDSASVQYRQID
ncbi:MAG: hypothetical protein AB1772_08000 [Candidatus Zixiibacteriota bacterium]